MEENTNTPNKKKFSKSGCGCLTVIIVVIAIVLLVVVSNLASSKTKSPAQQASAANTSTAVSQNSAATTQESKTQDPSTTAPVQTAVKVKADALYSDYNANQIAADNKYKDKVLDVSGTISTIGKDILGSPYVMLSSADGMDIVQCSFSSNDSDALAKLNKGDSITIEGQISGFLGYVELNKCKIAK